MLRRSWVETPWRSEQLHVHRETTPTSSQRVQAEQDAEHSCARFFLPRARAKKSARHGETIMFTELDQKVTEIIRLKQPFAMEAMRTHLENMLNAAQAEGRDLTPNETQNFDRILAAIKDQKREREQMRFEDGARIEMNGVPWETSPQTDVARRVRPMFGATYKQLFGASADTGGFNSIGSFLRAVAMADRTFDPRLRATATESSPSGGGFLVPTEYAATILQRALEQAIVLSRCQLWPMKFDSLKIPGVADYDHSSSVLYGGVSAAWANENGELADQSIAVEQIGLTAYKLGMLSNASSELVDDSTYESVLTAKLQEGAAWHLDNAFLFGDGAGKPAGMLHANNTALITVSKESSQPADGVVYENVLKMFSAMAPSCRQRATWLFNDGLIPACFEMQNRVFNLAGSEIVGGSAVPVFQMNADGTGTLLGRPVIFSEKLSAPGSLGDCAFVCLDQYAVGMRRDMRLERSIHAGFSKDVVYFRLTCRVDGESTWSAKLKEKSGNYVSPFVVLQAR
jgi:HK97 family phage major capsid protein